MPGDYDDWFLPDGDSAECPDCSAVIRPSQRGCLGALLDAIDAHECESS